MRTLSAKLTTAQKAMGPVLCKVVLTFGGTTKTYGVDTTNRILDLKRKVSEWGETAQITVDNREGNLTTLTLEGYSGVVSYGYTTSDGDEYSACAPMTVIGQKTDTIAGDSQAIFSLAGLYNLWGEQEALEAYSPDEINTDTVKTIMDALAAPTLAAFSGYPAHTITYDSGYDDSIINAFTPKDHFSIAKGESRLSAFKKLLAYTKCKAKVSNDAGTATIHVFQPTITGESYTYEYNDAIAASNHNFFDKSVRTRLVLPNKVIVRNHPDHDDSYTGNDTDAASYAALGDQYYTKTVYLRLASNAQAALIATAVLQRYQLAAEKGHARAPMNVGQEYADYVKITDSRVSDTRVGNVGSFEEHYTPGTFEMDFRFGTLEALGLAGTVPPRQAVVVALTARDPQQSLRDQVEYLTSQLESALQYMDSMRDAVNAVINTTNQTINYIVSREIQSEIFKLHVTGRLQIPQGTDRYT